MAVQTNPQHAGLLIILGQFVFTAIFISPPEKIPGSKKLKNRILLIHSMTGMKKLPMNVISRTRKLDYLTNADVCAG